MIFHSATKHSACLSPVYAMTGGLILPMAPGYNFSVAVWVATSPCWNCGETGVVMVVYLHEALDHKLASGISLPMQTSRQQQSRGSAKTPPKADDRLRMLASLIPDSI